MKPKWYWVATKLQSAQFQANCEQAAEALKRVGWPDLPHPSDGVALWRELFGSFDQGAFEVHTKNQTKMTFALLLMQGGAWFDLINDDLVGVDQWPDEVATDQADRLIQLGLKAVSIHDQPKNAHSALIRGVSATPDYRPLLESFADSDDIDWYF